MLEYHRALKSGMSQEEFFRELEAFRSSQPDGSSTDMDTSEQKYTRKLKNIVTVSSIMNRYSLLRSGKATRMTALQMSDGIEL